MNDGGGTIVLNRGLSTTEEMHQIDVWLN